MNSVFAAEAAILVHLKSVRVVLFVLHRVVIALLAFCARECDFDSHKFFLPIFFVRTHKIICANMILSPSYG